MYPVVIIETEKVEYYPINSDIIYIEQRQATGAQWVVIHPLFEVCARETCYAGGRRRREAWGHQKATEKQLRTTPVDSREAEGIRIGGEMGTQ